METPATEFRPANFSVIFKKFFSHWFPKFQSRQSLLLSFQPIKILYFSSIMVSDGTEQSNNLALWVLQTWPHWLQIEHTLPLLPLVHENKT